MAKVQVEVEELMEKLNDIVNEDPEFTRVEMEIIDSKIGDPKLKISAVDMVDGKTYDFGSIDGEID